ncbi:Ethanolamine-phosphate cytidylyltransferase [Linnemannia schmuckeri]|uniref:ethanolamine-phosphate cytidylyltransferase n=1 Tax=Linnemannia schmuckeri TaxID=64567 RepID=A0A9P5RYY3_9FUNG|nr:Ethanolamine-phosphate cytidylyltransferase [Linnemannia schmuckeri]
MSLTTATATTAGQRKPIRIWVDGCYDVMHHGHFNALRQAKAMGDIVVAGVHSDAELLLHKGPTVMNENERMAAVAACKWVDEVVPNAPYSTSLEWMDKYNCDYCVHGDDPSTLADGTDSYKYVKAQGRYLECKRTKGVSTTDLVNRMLLMTTLQQQEQDQGQGDRAVGDIDGGRTNSSRPEQQQQQQKKQQQHEVLSTARKISIFSRGNRDLQKGDRVIYVDGTFDLLHVGHIEFLKRAKARGDYLVVGVYDDATVRAIKGSAHHPLMSMHERVLALLACRHVDDVVLSAPYHLTEHVLDGDYTIHEVVRGSHHPHRQPRTTTTDQETNVENDPYQLAKERGIFVQLDEPAHEVTTRSIIHRIVKQRTMYEDRQRKRALKEAAAAAAVTVSAKPLEQ